MDKSAAKVTNGNEISMTMSRALDITISCLHHKNGHFGKYLKNQIIFFLRTQFLSNFSKLEFIIYYYYYNYNYYNNNNNYYYHYYY